MYDNVHKHKQYTINLHMTCATKSTRVEQLQMLLFTKAHVP